jgi:hypothetical protein
VTSLSSSPVYSSPSYRQGLTVYIFVVFANSGQDAVYPPAVVLSAVSKTSYSISSARVRSLFDFDEIAHIVDRS